LNTRQQSPIFSRCHDLLRWLVQAASRFPRDQRFVLAQRLLSKGFELEDALVAASIDRNHVESHLTRADVALTGLRRTLHLCNDLGYLSDRRYGHVTAMVAEVGRLLGGWRKSLQAR
jgi:hypothetical protein